jgi:B-box zinc finger
MSLSVSLLIYISCVSPALCEVVLIDADDIGTCSVCEASFFFNYKEDKLVQRETIYRELDEAVRNVITHDRTHHPQSHSASSSDSKHSTPSADGNPATADSPCNWEYGSGAVSAEPVSNVGFGAAQPSMNDYALLEDMARHIVDEPSARRLYEKRDDKTGLLVACRRSDRMIDESMNRHDFDATPVLLHCGHTVCRGCAYQCIKAHENARYDTMFAMVDCPVRCNRQTAFVCDLGVEWLPIDTRRIRLLQQQRKASRKPMCSEHKDRIATTRCTHALCAESPLMCAECDKAEHSSRNASKHVRVAPSQATASASASAASLCSTHQQPLIGVCVTDSTPICAQCVFDHAGHEFKRLHEVCCDWSQKLETLQRETLIRAHVLSDRTSSVQRHFDELVRSINTRFDAVNHSSDARRNELLFKARKWRKMQLEESKMLAAESSQLSATAMYERMLLQRALAPSDDSKSLRMSQKARSAKHKYSKLSSVRSSSAAAAAASTNRTSRSSIATLASTVPDAVLCSVAGNVHARGSAIEAQSVELTQSINAMQPEDMSIVFHNSTHASVLDLIQSLGEVNVCAATIWTQDDAPSTVTVAAEHDSTASHVSMKKKKKKKKKKKVLMWLNHQLTVNLMRLTITSK